MYVNSYFFNLLKYAVDLIMHLFKKFQEKSFEINMVLFMLLSVHKIEVKL